MFILSIYTFRDTNIASNVSLVGTNVGDIGLWEVGSRERLVLKNFKVWDLSACSVPLQVPLFTDQ